MEFFYGNCNLKQKYQITVLQINFHSFIKFPEITIKPLYYLFETPKNFFTSKFFLYFTTHSRN